MGGSSGLSKTLGLIRDRSPLCSIRSDDMCVRTDENPEVFVLCGFRRPGANARGGTRKNSKKWRLTTFSTVSEGRPWAAFRTPQGGEAMYQSFQTF